MSNTNFGNILRSLRKSENETQPQLAKILGVSRSAISMYEAGLREPNFEILESIADHYNVDMNYLTGITSDKYDYESDRNGRLASIPSAIFKHLQEIYDNDNAAIWNAYLNMQEDAENESITLPSDAYPYNPTHRIPILGRISAGMPLYAEENIEGWTYTELNHGGEYFALRVSGDSMTAARINDGDLLIIRRQDIVENGEIAVVMVGDDEATVKCFYRDKNIVTLMPQSYNPAHKPQIYDIRETSIHILGKLVQNLISY